MSNSALHRFLLPLLLIGSFAILTSPPPAEAARREPWEDQPSLRQEPLIRYQPVEEAAPLPPARVSAAEADAGALAARSAALWTEGGHARTFLLGGKKLIGRATIHLDALPPGESRTLLLQVKREREPFHTVASVEAAGSGPVTLTFPGEEATALRVLISGDPEESNPLTSLQAEQIVLAADKRIMLLGDSITAGKYADDNLGYRKVLYDQLRAGGFNVDFVGAYGDSPYEGHFQGGRKTFDFYPDNGFRTPILDVTADMNNYRPHIVGILLGTNNLNDLGDDPVGPCGTAPAFNSTPAGQMAKLIAYLLRWNNNTYGADLQDIFLFLLPPIKGADSLVAHYNIELARLARDYAGGAITGKAEPVHIVDLYTPFYEDPVFNNNKSTYYPPYLSTPLDPANRLHPNNAGHQLIGQTCYQAFRSQLSGTPPWFTDISWETNTAGYDAEYGGQGIAVADADGDGRDDLYTTRTVTEGAFRRDFFLRQDSEGLFAESSESWSVRDDGDSRGALFVDIDSDGDLDLFNGNSPGRNRLYENLNRSSFRDITATAGIAEIAATTTALLAFDADGDEDIDLYAVNSRTLNELYLNQGNGRFQRADRGANDAEEPGVASESATAADFDQDGDVDIYIAKNGGANRLYLNNGAGWFSDGAAAAGLALNLNCKSAHWADLDNDADLDLIVAVANTSDPGNLLRLFRNDNGVFTEVSTTANIPMNGFTALTGDFDNDGDLDIITTSDRTTGGFYRNGGGWRFSLVNATGAEVRAGDVRSGVALDYDRDGDLDFFLTRSDIFNLFRENTLDNGNHYLLVDPAGPGGSASAFGTRIWCYQAGRAGDPAALLGYREVLSGSGHLAQSPLVQHFGLAGRTACDLIVQFIDNTFLVLGGVPADQTIRVAPLAPTVNPGAAARLIAHAGNNQSGTVGSPLPVPLTVKAVDGAGAPVAGLHVDFSLTAGDAALLLPAGAGSTNLWLEAESGAPGGSLAWAYDASSSGNGLVFVPPSKRTNGRDTLAFSLAEGAASTLWIRARTGTAGSILSAVMNGGSPYTQSLEAGSDWAWVRLGSPGGWNLAAGTHRLVLEIAPGSLQIDRILVSASSSYIPSGAGESGSDPFATDSQGLARRTLQLGTTAGPVEVSAQAIEGGRTLTASFRATAQAGAAASIMIADGNNQVASQGGAPLPSPLIVAVSDGFGNPVQGEMVLFSVRAGGGSLVPADGRVATDSDGRAQAVYITGTLAGQQTIAASPLSLSSKEVLFSATVANGAANLVYLQGDAQADTVRALLAQPVRFKVTRADGQPAASIQITVTAFDGGRVGKTAAVGADSILQLVTGSDGVVSCYWRLGPVSGDQHLKVEAPGLQGSPRVLRAAASPGSPYRILAIDGDGQNGAVKTKLDNPLTARVADRYGNPVPEHPVQFRLLAGGGFLNTSGSDQYSTATNASGAASVELMLGEVAGVNVSRVEAVSQYHSHPLTGSPVIFYASATAGPPHFFYILSGNQQSRVAGSLLPDSLAVMVTDYYQNPLIGHTVTFRVTGGDGKINGLTQAAVATDGGGRAWAWFRLGTKAGPGLQQVTAAAQGLASETLLFTATATADIAARMSYHSGRGQTGLAGSRLADPLVVFVQDRHGNPVAGHQVQFSVTAGGGSFIGEPNINLTSDEEGLAKAWLTLGPAVGDSVHRVSATSLVRSSTTPLIGSPVLFSAGGATQQAGDIKKIEVFAGEGQSAVVDQWLAGALSARVIDTNNLPVKNHPIVFRIARGNGRLGSGQDTLVSLPTNSSGIAEVIWRLGTLAGDSTQAVEMICLGRSGLPVPGSHRLIYAAARAGAPDINRSTLSVESPVSADGLSASAIITTVRDSYGNPVAGQGILLVGSGLEAELNPNQGYSDGGGLFRSAAVSSLPGSFSVQARVATSSQWLTEAKTISFIAPPAARLEVAGGDGQTAMVTNWLREPLAVRVLDGIGSALQDREVRFSLVEGSAEIAEPGSARLTALSSPSAAAAVLTVRSDGDGVAAIDVRMGTRSGRVVIFASLVDDPESRFRFQLRALPGEAAELIRISGDGQSGTTWHRLSQPLIVQVRDAFANPVPAQQVLFSTGQEQGWFQPNAMQTTDSTGAASVLWYLGGVEGTQSAEASVAGAANSPLRFEAATLPNQPPQISLADSVQIRENEKWSYQLEINDLEGDSVRINLKSRPEGLEMNGEGRIDWQPSYQQAGRYELPVEARDQFGAASSARMLLVVVDVNRPPLIDGAACLPQQQEGLQLTKPDVIDFFVSASDPDGDALSYSWYLNGAFCAYGKPTYRLQSELVSSGDAQVKVVVSDRSTSVSHTWTLKLVSAVWLAGFQAQAEPGRGITLSWRTLLESDHLGFFVQRAGREEGPFQTISSLLAPAAEGSYRFTDESAEAGRLYYYRLQDLSRDGSARTHPALQARLPLPLRFNLSANYPNPFNAGTRLTVALPGPGTVRAEVIDLMGRSVRRLHDGETEGGYLTLTWDGRDELGLLAASGVYYCRVSAGNETASRKLVLVK